VPSGELTSVEQSLVEHVSRGERLDLADDEAVHASAMRSWDESRTCRATVIRDILRGRLAADPDPHGLRLRGARISGRLDLANLTTEVSLELRGCLLEEGVFARDARLASVSLAGCQLEHPDEPPLYAEGLTCRMLDLRRARVIGHADAGAVCLLGANIGSSLYCTGTSLRNDSGPALSGDALQVGGSMFLNDGFTATGAGEDGAVRLPGAHIGINLHCTGSALRNKSGPALIADGLKVSLSMFLRDKFTAIGSGEAGTVRLVGACIGGQLSCIAATLRNDSGPALLAHSLQVGQGMLLGGFTATGSGGQGAIRLTGAHIGGSLECDGASLRNESGPALSGDALQVDQAMFLRAGFTATGAGDNGAVRLRSAHIGGSLDCTGASLHNNSGPALDASSLHVGQGMYLRGKFTATGDDGAVRLRSAHIGGSLHCDGASLRNESGPALVADGLQVSRGMYLTDGFTAFSGGVGVAVDLTGTRVGGMLFFDPARLEYAADPHGRLAADGLTYTGVPQQIPARDWLDLLRNGTRRYAAQPYQHLAAGYRALGDERQARQILMAQRDDELARTHPRWPERLWGKTTKVTLGYGYQPWRALLFLVLVVVISCVLAFALGSHGALAQTSKTATPGRPCTAVEQVSVGLDLNLPVGTSIARTGCDLTKDAASATAAWLSIAGWGLRLLAWVFAALFIAGFTSAVRKT
jgi:hypothetical protein